MSVTKEISTEKTIKKENQGPFSLKIKTVFNDFESANSKALEYELMNFKAMIVPEKNKYYIELEKLKDLSDAQSLLKTLASGNINASIVKSPVKFLLPQKKLNEELKKLTQISSKPTKEVKQVKNTIQNNTKVVSNELKNQNIYKTSETKVQKVIKTTEVKTKPIVKKEIPAVKKKKEIKKIVSKKPEYLKPISEKVTPKEEKEASRIIEPKGTYYSLQAGAYSERFGAERLAAFLRNNSELPVFVKKVNNFYKVYIGTFRNSNIARNVMNKMVFPRFDNEVVSFFVAKIKN
jgi:cell division protein FtsN